jgi:hypothetical protein
MTASPEGSVGLAIADYTGRDVLDLDIVPDPNIPGVFAARALVRRRKLQKFNIYFLIRVPLKNVTADDLEECEFTCWPPEVMR